MEIYTDRNGKTRAFMNYKDPSGKWRKVSVTLPKNTPAERRKAELHLTEMINAKTAPGRDYSLADLMDRYIAYQYTAFKPSTAKRNYDTLNVIVKLIGPKVAANKLTSAMVRDALLSHTQNPTTLNEYLKRFRALIRWAYSSDYIASTRCIDKLANFKDKSAREKITDKYLERDEIPVLLEALSPYYRNIVELLLLTGLRIGELVALDDEDVTSDYISITKTYEANVNLINTPKTYDSVREVSVQSQLLPIIKAIRITSKENKLRSGRSDSSAFIVSDRGTRVSYRKVEYVMAETTQKVLGRRLTVHALRHTHASILAEQGVPLEEIQLRLGHGQNSKVTRDIYIHVTKRVKERAADRIRDMVMY